MTSLVDRFISRYGRLPTEFDPDYLEMLQMSKYVIQDVPNSQPGKCANCGASKNDGRKYVDIGLEVPWYGAAVFCTLCLKDIARHAGLFDALEEQIKYLTGRIADTSSLRTDVEELSATLVEKMEEFKEHVTELRTTLDDSSPDSSPNVESDEATESGSGTDSTESDIKPTKPRASKSTSGSGPQDFSSLTDLLKT